MKRKPVLAVVAVFVIIAVLGLFSGCTKNGVKKVVVLGDSIAEAVIGPSPITERYNYGYYGLLDQVNPNLEVYNASVSGHESGHLLDILNQDLPSYTRDKKIYKNPNSRNIVNKIQEADIVHVSIFGNDLLGEYMNEILENFVNADYDGKFDGLTEEQKSEKLKDPDFLKGVSDRLHKIMYSGTTHDETGLWSGNVDENAKALVERLSQLKKKDAKVFVQKIYSPIHSKTNLVMKKVKDAVKEKKGLDFNTEEGRKYLNNITKQIIKVLFNPLEKYIEGKSDFSTIDPLPYYESYANGNDEKARELIFPDGIHPTNIGHALLFQLTQNEFHKKGIISDADFKKALKNYKNLRTQQYKRLFKSNKLSEDNKIYRKIKKAKTIEEVTQIYFDAIKGKTPNLVRNY